MKSITFKKDENKGPVIVMIGRRDTGKSYLVRDLLYHHQDVPLGTVISGTEAGNGFYAAHVPKLFIHEEYNTVLIENILRRQKIVLKKVIVVVLYVTHQVIVFQIRKIYHMMITTLRVVYITVNLIGLVNLMVYLFIIQQVTLNGV